MFPQRYDYAIKEAEMWRALLHENVLEFVGVLLDGYDVYLISEFAVNGTATQYLRSHPDADRKEFVSLSEFSAQNR